MTYEYYRLISISPAILLLASNTVYYCIVSEADTRGGRKCDASPNQIIMSNNDES